MVEAGVLVKQGAIRVKAGWGLPHDIEACELPHEFKIKDGGNQVMLSLIPLKMKEFVIKTYNINNNG